MTCTTTWDYFSHLKPHFKHECERPEGHELPHRCRCGSYHNDPKLRETCRVGGYAPPRPAGLPSAMRGAP